MPSPVDFYFDFSSPYGYFASARIDAIGAKHGRGVSWHPILLGAVFKVTGGAPLPSLPLKGDYAKVDIPRCARAFGLPFTFPAKFPIPTQTAARMTVWAQGPDPERAKTLAAGLYRAYFAENRDITNPEVCGDVAAACGLDRAAAIAAINDRAVKDKLKLEVDEAIARNVFGSPYFLVDGEPFWGADRLDHVERWLATGGW
jgi:2-hydroxychromene-2-carboxylate isomerase